MSMCIFSVNFQEKKKRLLQIDSSQLLFILSIFRFIVQFCFLALTCVSNCHSGMASGGMCTCLMSSGHTLSIGQHGLPWEAESLERSTAPRAVVSKWSASHPGSVASRGLPPRKLTSYFNDLHPKIKEIHISALNLK